MQMNYSYASDLPLKNLCKLAKRAEKNKEVRNYQKQVLVMIKRCFGTSQINSIPEQRVILHNFSLQNKHNVFPYNKREEINIHSQRKIKEILNPEKHTFSINSEHKSTKKSPVSSSLPWFLFSTLFPAIAVKNRQENLANLNHLITQRDNIHARAHDTFVD